MAGRVFHLNETGYRSASVRRPGNDCALRFCESNRAEIPEFLQEARRGRWPGACLKPDPGRGYGWLQAGRRSNRRELAVIAGCAPRLQNRRRPGNKEAGVHARPAGQEPQGMSVPEQTASSWWPCPARSQSHWHSRCHSRCHFRQSCHKNHATNDGLTHHGSSARILQVLPAKPRGKRKLTVFDRPRTGEI